MFLFIQGDKEEREDDLKCVITMLFDSVFGPLASYITLLFYSTENFHRMIPLSDLSCMI